MQVRVFDPEMCCSSGVCGPAPDPALIEFQQACERLQAAGAEVQRYQLSRQPQAFVGTPAVYQLLLQRGAAALPVVMVDGEIVSAGAYPTDRQLAAARATAVAPAPAGRRPDRGGGGRRR
jgi:hypothetical protein